VCVHLSVTIRFLPSFRFVCYPGFFNFCMILGELSISSFVNIGKFFYFWKSRRIEGIKKTNYWLWNLSTNIVIYNTTWKISRFWQLHRIFVAIIHYVLRLNLYTTKILNPIFESNWRTVRFMYCKFSCPLSVYNVIIHLTIFKNCFLELDVLKLNYSIGVDVRSIHFNSAFKMQLMVLLLYQMWC